MKQVTMHEAKTHLSRLVDSALAGEEVIIARRDKPLVRLQVIEESSSHRQVGALKGLIRKMPSDFNESIEDWEEPWPGTVLQPESEDR